MPGKGIPDCPKWLLPEAQDEWRRLCEKLNQIGVLTEVDRSAFAAYCQSYARWKEAQDAIFTLLTNAWNAIKTARGCLTIFRMAAGFLWLRKKNLDGLIYVSYNEANVY